VRVIAAIEAVLRARWFADAALLAICLTILALAAAIQPSTEMLSLFGHEIPVLCTWRRLTGMSCPGCGMTRSLVFLAHGRPIEAFEMNVFGPLVFAWVAAQPPWRAVRLWRRRRV
jgi:hypothetical protein